MFAFLPPLLPAQAAHSNPFLAGRALWAAAKLSPLMSQQQVDGFLPAAVAGEPAVMGMIVWWNM